ncbi:hypothetical protein BKA64DRAFT_771422 [Cadophora sp. MPI-SDFR-AT-0126]|nr:hypothetical protein BKA64DRAFT_771422 [Leotiomycetes sp. MPI-SDFR-AT-0126]
MKVNNKMAPILCELCYPKSYDYASHESLEKHMRTKHPTERVRNKLQDPSRSHGTTSQRSMNSHTRRQDPNGPVLPLQCKYCGPGSFVYAHKSSLKNHMRDKHSEDQLWCKFCGFNNIIFPSKDALQEHIKSKHADEAPLVCDICRTSFYTVRGFRYHVRNKTCLNPKSNFQRSLVYDSSSSIIPETGVLRPNAASETSGFALDGAGQGDTVDHQMTDIWGMGQMGENNQAVGPMTDEEYETYMQSHWQQDPDMFNPIALDHSHHLQDLDMFDQSHFTQVTTPSTAYTVDQDQMTAASTSNTSTPDSAWNNFDQSVSAQVAIASAHDFGFDFDALEQLDSEDNHLTKSSMTTQEYQSHLRSKGL